MSGTISSFTTNSLIQCSSHGRDSVIASLIFRGIHSTPQDNSPHSGGIFFQLMLYLKQVHLLMGSRTRVNAMVQMYGLVYIAKKKKERKPAQK